MTSEEKTQFEARMKRFNDSVTMQQPDRVPVCPWNFHFFPAEVNGMSKKDAMVDHTKFYSFLKKVVLDYEFDMAPACSVYPSPTWEALGVKTWKWPGHGLADNRVFQFTEQEVMKADEYDKFLSDPDGFTTRVLFPRTTTAFEAMEIMPPIHWFFNFPYLMGPFFGMPPFVTMLDSLIKLGQEWNKHEHVVTQCYKELEELGFPKTYGSIGFTAFDTVSIWLRGQRGTVFDMYRNPDKLLKAIELCNVMQTQLSIIQCQISGIPRVSLFVYRGADGFLNDEQFRKFFWPSLLQEIDEILKAGFMPMPFFEGDWTSRLKYFSDLPKHKFPLHFDRIDRQQAKKFLANSYCFWGNIPVSLMEHGTQQEVQDDVKELIDTFAGNGGLIVDSAGSITDDTKPENVRTMVDAVHKYGTT